MTSVILAFIKDYFDRQELRARGVVGMEISASPVDLHGILVTLVSRDPVKVTRIGRLDRRDLEALSLDDRGAMLEKVRDAVCQMLWQHTHPRGLAKAGKWRTFDERARYS